SPAASRIFASSAPAGCESSAESSPTPRGLSRSSGSTAPTSPPRSTARRSTSSTAPCGRARAGRSSAIPPASRPGLPSTAGRLAPTSPASRGRGAPTLGRLLAALLEQVALPAPPELLPADLPARHGLPPLGEALAALHAPGEGEDPVLLNRRRSPAHLRLIYG